MSLRTEYERLCATPSDIFQHLPTLVGLVHDHNAQHVIELGTRTGVSTVAWLYGLEQTGGRLTSVDLDAKPPIGDHDAWTFIQGDDTHPGISGSLEPAEIVFIDTSHLFTHTLQELNIYRWLVRPGGVLVLHDTELPIPEGHPLNAPRFPVRRAVEQFVAETGFAWHNYPECNGLGVIEVD